MNYNIISSSRACALVYRTRVQRKLHCPCIVEIYNPFAETSRARIRRRPPGAENNIIIVCVQLPAIIILLLNTM